MDISISNRLQNICIPCEATKRDKNKFVNRWLVKARDAVRRHSVRLKISKESLINDYGWSIRRLAHDAAFQYQNGCPYCEGKFLDMGHGLYDITIDVVDPKQKPYYATNTKWICQTCNRQKGASTPEAFNLRKRVWARWKKFGGVPRQYEMFPQ